MNLPVTEQTVWLPLRFGYRTLARPRRRMQVLQMPFVAQRPDHLSELAAAYPDADCLVRSLPVGEPLPRLSRFAGRLRFVQRQYRRHFIDLTTSWDEYQARFSSRTLQGMRRKVRKFAAASDGSIDWRQYRDADEMIEFHRLARRVSSRTYQERLLNAGLPDSDSFVRGLVERAREGRARGYLLFLRDEAIAYLYCPIEDGILRYAFLGYLQEHAALSPGTVLQWLVIEELYREGGYRMFDFTAGEGAHKELFGKDSLLCADVHLLRPTAANHGLVCACIAAEAASRLAGGMLNRLGLKSRLKRSMRGNV